MFIELYLFVLNSQGGAKIQEAAYIYDELIDKFGASPSLLNGLAVAKMHQGQWDEAEASLKESITKVSFFALLFFVLVFSIYHQSVV